ncbi:MAG: YopX family protein [Bacteroidota bacterium]
MSRETKFRVWVSGNGHVTINQMRYERPVALFEWMDDMPYGMRLMQFTGLQDKTGKDVYEGDIVQVKINQCTPDADFKEVYTLLEEKGQVLMKEGAWQVENDDKEYGGGYLFAYDEVEVIGNIHQHPELLSP